MRTHLLPAARELQVARPDQVFEELGPDPGLLSAETVILLQPSLPLVGVSTGMERGSPARPLTRLSFCCTPLSPFSRRINSDGERAT